MEFKRFTLSGALFVSLLGMFTTSCEKVDQQEVSPAPLPHINNMYWQRLRFFNGVDWCYNWQGNCLPEIIVTPTYPRAALNGHFAKMTGNPAAVKAFFNGSGWNEFFPVLTEKGAAPFLERLRSGECDIKRIEYDTKAFYYAGAGELTPDKNEMVLQVTFAQ